MKVYFKMKNGEEYFFRTVSSLRGLIHAKTCKHYESLVEGIKAAYGDVQTVILQNVRVL